MKLNDFEKTLIDSLYSLGQSGREIAKQIGRSKSAVNDYLKGQNEISDLQTKENDSSPRILFVDVETAPATVLAFGRFNQNFTEDHVVDEGGYLLCYAAKWLGSDKIISNYIKYWDIQDKDDSILCDQLWELYEQADIVVAHNAIKFDHKVIQTRCAANYLPPLPKVKVVDTLQMAKKHLRLPSNKLDSIGSYFGLGRKLDTGGIKLWADVLQGDADAMSKMLEYNEQDVNLLEKVYLRLRHLGSDANYAMWYNDEYLRCPSCGSEAVEETGRSVKMGVSSYDEYRCDDCGAVHRSRQNTVSKVKRQTLLIG